VTVNAELVLFAVLALGALVGALLTISRPNPVTAVMSLVGTFFALAGLYATLDAHFLTVLQILVYAGAIMVLFIFVVMILNREEIERVSFRGILTRGLAVLVMGYAFLVLARVIWTYRAVGPLAATGANLPADYGTVAGVGMSLFTDLVFPFEAISLLLLVAIVGGIVVSRSHKQEAEAEETARKLAVIHSQTGPETRVGAVPEAGAGHGHGHGHGGHASQAAHHLSRRDACPRTTTSSSRRCCSSSARAACCCAGTRSSCSCPSSSCSTAATWPSWPSPGRSAIRRGTSWPSS